MAYEDYSLPAGQAYCQGAEECKNIVHPGTQGPVCREHQGLLPAGSAPVRPEDLPIEELARLSPPAVPAEPSAETLSETPVPEPSPVPPAEPPVPPAEPPTPAPEPPAPPAPSA